MNLPVDPPAEPHPPTPPPAPATAAASEATIDPSQLTPEEQMALYEKDLKENDWGHQPC